MSTKTIYDALVAAGMTREGACAMLGNMKAESSMRSNIAQRGMTKLTDAQYTAAADNGLIDFAHDSVGYGLCQWTYHTRKANLLAIAKSKGVSVGDEDMQVQFCIRELRTEYTGVWAVLTASHDLLQCTQTVCTQYERPAVNNVGTRYEFAQQFMAWLESNGSETPNSSPAPATQEQQSDVILLQLAMQQDGYWDKSIDGLNTADWREAYRAFAGDVLGVDIK